VVEEKLERTAEIERKEKCRERETEREREKPREREARLGLAEPKTSINGGGGVRRRRCMVPVREQ
jgi:hypothetical protein